MKVKLLKKIHKRYNWYFNANKEPVLIDHLKKHVIIYDFDYVKKQNQYTDEDIVKKVEVSHEEWCYRNFKWDILKSFGLTWKRERHNYKIAIRKYQKKLPK